MENENLYTIIFSSEETLLLYKNNNITKLLSINVIKNIIKIENPEILQKKLFTKVIIQKQF